MTDTQRTTKAASSKNTQSAPSPPSSAYASRRNVVSLLRLSYITGAVLDGIAGIRLTYRLHRCAWPVLRSLCPAASASSLSAAAAAAPTWTQQDSATAVATALMWGWTFLLVWGCMRPVQRRGVLGLTLAAVIPFLGVSLACEIVAHGMSMDAAMGSFVGIVVVPLFSMALWFSRGLSVD